MKMRLTEMLAIAFFGAIWALAGLEIVYALWAGKIYGVNRWVTFDANPIWASILLAVHMCAFIVVSAFAILPWQARMDFRRWAACRRPSIDTAIKGPTVAGEDVQRDH